MHMCKSTKGKIIQSLMEQQLYNQTTDLHEAYIGNYGEYEIQGTASTTLFQVTLHPSINQYQASKAAKEKPMQCSQPLNMPCQQIYLKAQNLTGLFL